jgi:hypothetical protein|uniref:C2H2-type domain-containing protein n=1 Tax=viral metagenome TaxID=1070528 RepID=A0A6C0IL15_9ZZZZ
MTNEKNAKKSKSFYCNNCDFKCIKLSNWNAHITTRKHKIRTTTKNDEGKNSQKMPHHNKVYMCACGREFKHASSLWNHKQKCTPKQEPTEETPTETREDAPIMPDMSVFIELLKQNQEFKELMIEQSKQIQDTQQENQQLQKQLIEAVKTNGPHIENQTNINNNQKFNLNLFLNEQCKDAINMSDFLENMELDLEDLTETGRLGYAGGISRILVNKLRELDTYKRPLHCTDMKRETLYIRENDEWLKENNSKDKLKEIVDKVSNKNCKNIKKWADEHSEYNVFDTPQNQEYLKVSNAALGGFGEQETKQFRDKIVRNVIKEVMVNKYV